MTTDIRISVKFLDHFKTKKLEKKLGSGVIKNLVSLWIWTAENEPSGELHNMDAEDIELVSRWDGEPGVLVEQLVNLDFLEAHKINESTSNRHRVDIESTSRDEGNEFRYSIHNWRLHNPWAAGSQSRSDKSRFSKLAHVCPEAHAYLLKQGRVSVSKAEYEELLVKYQEHKNCKPPKKKGKTND